MGALSAYLAEREHRHTWETRVTLAVGEIELCPCGAARRLDLGEEEEA